MNYRLILVAAVIATACTNQNQEDSSPFEKVNSIEERYELPSITEIHPRGWIEDQIKDNLDGFVGRLDTLVPSLILEDKIYGEDRLTKKVKSKDVGALGVEGDWQVQFLWWNSETQSNWRDGYIRSAILSNNEKHLAKIKSYINYILSTQDADGYLGIYDTDLRYTFDNENGELWSKCTLLRGLLAWYEYSEDENVLKAIQRAAKNLMENYPVGESHPFYSKNPNVGGTSHGLTITDVFESLYRITKDNAYRDYCLFLYKDFSEQVLNEDAQYKKLINDTMKLEGHGVHTYEHLRCLAAAYYASGNPKLNDALDSFLKKIDCETTASGAAIGDEWIGGRQGDATTCGYEYCSLQELMHSYLSLLVKSGDTKFAERAEKIFLNAAQGARNPGKSCIAYLKSDNSYYMTGGLNGDTTDKNQTRYSYSPVHQEAAVCCVPNAGRIAPYYVQHMWLKGKNELVASLLGPCFLKTTMNSQEVMIEEKTNYPFENTILFEVKANTRFALKIRKPTWASSVTVSQDYREDEGFIIIDKSWGSDEIVVVKFNADVMVRTDLNGERYFTYGSLVLARQIESKEIVGKAFPVPGFHNYKYSPENLTIYKYASDTVSYTDQLRFKTSLLNSATNQKEEVELIPMGKTILRQVTFK